MQKHLEVRLITQPTLSGQGTRSRQFLRRDTDGNGFRGAWQIGLAQTAQLSPLSSRLKWLGEDLGVGIPPGSFLFLAGKLGNGLVGDRKQLTFFVDFLLLWSQRMAVTKRTRPPQIVKTKAKRRPVLVSHKAR